MMQSYCVGALRPFRPLFCALLRQGPTAAHFSELLIVFCQFAVMEDSKALKKLKKESEKKQKILDKAAKEEAKRQAKESKRVLKLVAELEKEDLKQAKKMAKEAKKQAKVDSKVTPQPSSLSCAGTTSMYVPAESNRPCTHESEQDRVARMMARASRLNGIYSRSTDNIYFADNVLTNGPLPIGNFLISFLFYLCFS
jgi:C4-dicarboxylate-specific signal transduction histidine kinase